MKPATHKQAVVEDKENIILITLALLGVHTVFCLANTLKSQPPRIDGLSREHSDVGGKSRYFVKSIWDLKLTESLQMWNQFFDDMLNPKGEEKECLPSLLKWRQRLLNVFNEVDKWKRSCS